MNTTYADKKSETDEIKARDNEKYLECIREMNLMTDELMNKVFPDKRVTQLVLRIILQKELTVIKSRVQHNVSGAKGRSVAFDVFAVDNSGKRYNIEIQKRNDGAAPRRARLNCAYMDSSALKKGKDSAELPETYVIFITENDCLKGGLPIYNIEQVIMQTNTVFDSGLHIIYVNSQIQDDTPLGKLMSDFWCRDPEKANYEVIKEKLRYFKQTEEGVSEMSELVRRFFAKELAEGLAKGEKKKSIEIARNLMEQTILDDDKIAAATKLSIEEVQSIRQSSNL